MARTGLWFTCRNAPHLKPRCSSNKNSCGIASFRFVSFRFVSFRFVSFRLRPCRIAASLNQCTANTKEASKQNKRSAYSSHNSQPPALQPLQAFQRALNRSGLLSPTRNTSLMVCVCDGSVIVFWSQKWREPVYGSLVAMPLT